MISERTCSLLDRDRINRCLEKILQKKCNGLHISNAIWPNEKPHTRLYSMRKERKSSIIVDKQPIYDICHRRMENADTIAVENMIKKPSYGMNANKQIERLRCETCVQAKATKQPATENLVENSRTMMMHTDSCDMFKEGTFGGKKLFVTLSVTLHRYISD